MDNKGNPYLGEDWNKFKMVLVTLKDVVQTHFDKLMASIFAGLTEIAEETKEEDEMDYNFSGEDMNNKGWVCTRCNSVNNGEDPYSRRVC